MDLKARFKHGTPDFYKVNFGIWVKVSHKILLKFFLKFDLGVTEFYRLLIGTSYTNDRDGWAKRENASLADADSVRSLKNYHVARINRLIVDYAAVCLGSRTVCTRVDGTPNK